MDTREEVMKKLRITGKTTLQKYRDESRFKFYQPDSRTILYDSDSINDYLEKHFRKSF